MIFTDYENLATRTCAPPDKGIERLTPAVANTLDLLTEQAQGIAAAIDTMKKHIFYGKEIDEEVVLLDRNGIERFENVKPDIRQMNAIHAAIGLITEALELSEAIITPVLRGGTMDEANVFEELGDLQWYTALLTKTLGINMDDVQKANIDKLAARYGDKFDDYKALNRDLAREQQALSGANNTNAGATPG